MQLKVMKIFEGTLPLLILGLFLDFCACVEASGFGENDKKRDKPRSQSLGDKPRSSASGDKPRFSFTSEKHSRRSISVVDVELDDSPPKGSGDSFECEESSNSLSDLAVTAHSHLRPNVGTFDNLPTRFHVMAPLHTSNHEIGDYRELFPNSPTPVKLNKGRIKPKLPASLSTFSSTSDSSSGSSSSSSSSSEDEGKGKRKQRRRGNSKGSLISEKSKKKDKDDKEKSKKKSDKV